MAKMLQNLEESCLRFDTKLDKYCFMILSEKNNIMIRALRNITCTKMSQNEVVITVATRNSNSGLKIRWTNCKNKIQM